MEVHNTNKKYKTSSHAVFSCQYHVIFCPKYRRSVLNGKIADRLKEIIKEKQGAFGYEILDMEVMPDHVHLLIDVDPKIGIYHVVTQIKGYTSKTLRLEFPELKKRLPTLWTHSKFISTVGAVTLEVVKRYIEEQKNR
jgi:putative transposase